MVKSVNSVVSELFPALYSEKIEKGNETICNAIYRTIRRRNKSKTSPKSLPSCTPLSYVTK